MKPVFGFIFVAGWDRGLTPVSHGGFTAYDVYRHTVGTQVSDPCPSDSLLEIIFRIFIPLSHHIGA